MAPSRRKVLLVFANPYARTRPHLPYGLLCVAGALADHDVRVLSPYHMDGDPLAIVRAEIASFEPDVIGIGIRNIDTQVATEWGRGNFAPADGAFETTYFVPELRRLVAAIREALDGRDVPLVLGGGGFQTAPRALLEELGVAIGIVGPGEDAFRHFVDTHPDGDWRATPGLILKQSARIYRANPKLSRGDDFREHLHPSAIPKHLRASLADQAMGVRTRSGCDKACVYCLDPILEGRRVKYRAIDDVIAQLEAYAADPIVRRIFFTDAEFNVPDTTYSSALLRAIIERGLNERFAFASQFVPNPFPPEFAALLVRAGFTDVCITIDSVDPGAARRTGKKYTAEDVPAAVRACLASGLRCLVDFVLGSVGDDDRSIAQTLEFVARHDLHPHALSISCVIGLRVYEETPLGAWLRKAPARFEGHVYGKRTYELLEPLYVSFPESPRAIYERWAPGLKQRNLSWGLNAPFVTKQKGHDHGRREPGSGDSVDHLERGEQRQVQEGL